MRWSSLPVSVAAHVAAFLAFLIIPLAADVDLPPIARAPGKLIYMPAVAAPRMPVVVPRSRPPQVQRPLRVGGVIKEPRKLATVAPIYQAIARAASGQGVVLE